MRYFTYYKDNNIVNLSNSILRKYNIPTFHPSIEKLDKILQNHCKIALFLFDGMGKSIAERHLSSDSFLLKHKFDTISSTFPPTTVAATNGLKSARFPAETGWLGWTFYVKEINDAVGMFTQRTHLTGIEVDYDYSKFDYVSIFEMIRQQAGIPVFENFPADLASTHNDEGFIDNEEMFEFASEFLKDKKEAFVYSYNLEPDHTLHGAGTSCRAIKNIVLDIQEGIKKFAEENKDTLIIVISDHSHVDVRSIYYDNHPGLKKCVESVFSIEARCASFRVRKGKEQDFLDYYNKHLKNDYDILTKQQVIDTELFGPTKDLKFINEFVGDYVLIAIGDRTLELFKKNPMVATHGGGTIEENLINVYIFNQ